jgi:hypothetical protein
MVLLMKTIVYYWHFVIMSLMDFQLMYMLCVWQTCLVNWNDLCVHLCAAHNKQDHICSPKQMKTQRKLEPSIWSTGYEIHWNSLSKPNPRSSLHPQKGGPEWTNSNQRTPYGRFVHHMDGKETFSQLDPRSQGVWLKKLLLQVPHPP